MHATVIKQEHWLVSTIEHLMATFYALGVTHAQVQVASSAAAVAEVPILDGSALPFVHGLLEIGLQELPEDMRYLTPKETIVFSDEHGRILELASAAAVEGGRDLGLYVDYTADFSHLLLGTSHFAGQITPEFFINNIAPARTFGFLEQLPLLRQHGLARGSSLGNTVVISNEEFLNERRFADECVRHKVLDLLGDLALLGKPLAGKVRAVKTGHNFNRLVIEHHLSNPGEWELI
jgi:UDP-3-O-[3-hydroxymyristoyl] N-acetylglucosamine deacetylase